MAGSILFRRHVTQICWLIIIHNICVQQAAKQICTDRPIPNTKDVAVYCKVPVLTRNMTFTNTPFNRTKDLTITCARRKAFSEIESNIFSQFIYAERLTITNCIVMYLPEKSFQGLKSLNALVIQYPESSKIEVSLPKMMSPDLQNVTKIILSGMGLKTVPETFWLNLPNVSEVSFKLNKFPDLKWIALPVNFSRPSQISSLVVSQNLLRNLTANSFRVLQNLVILQLKKNFIRFIHEKAFTGLHSLQVLDLSYNNLTALSRPVFTQLYDLQRLILASNDLKTLPPDIFNDLTNLKKLNLNNNHLHFSNSHADLFCNLQQLTDLTFNNDNISFFPTSIFRGLTSLRLLDLTNNYLRNINSSSFVYLKSLQTLLIAGCDLTTSELFVHLVSLKKLVGNKNKLSQIKYDDFQKCTDLEYINFGRNGITTIAITVQGIKQGIFANFLRLQHLVFNWNSLSEFDYFMVPDSLTTLDLTRTRISVLRDKLDIRHRKKIAKLMLTQNTFQEWNTKSFGKHIQEIICGACIISVIRSCTFCDLQELKTVRCVSCAVENMERFAFRCNTTGAPSVTPVVKISPGSGLCNVVLSWVIIDIKFIKLATTHGEHVCQMTRRCKNKSSDQSLEGTASKSASSQYAVSAVLDCGSNNMTSFRYEGHENVTHLYFDDNRLQTVTNGTFNNMVSLQFLYLNNSCISFLDTGAFFGLKELTNLYLHDNKLKVINPRQFVQQLSLSILWLQNNRISSFHELDFQGLSSLKELQLDNNCIGHLIGYEFYKLKTLTSLYLNSNNLTSINANSFYPMHQLRKLHLEKNSLFKIPPHALRKSRKIEALYLSGNQFRKIGKKTFPIPLKLTSLHFDNNLISEIDSFAFQNMQVLENLNLGHNLLKFLCGSPFKKNTKLRYLWLNNNYLQVIEGKLFLGLSRLENLFLHHNRLISLNMDGLASIRLLKNLTLHNNHLQNISVWRLPLSLQHVTVSGNNFSCDCAFLKQFQTWVLGYGNNKVTDVETVICQHQNGTSAKLPILQYVQRYCQTQTSLLVPLLVTGATFVTVIFVAALGYLHRLEMQIWLYSRYGVRLFYPVGNADSSRKYHAFVAFSSEDEEFVGYDLVPCLEPKFKLCIHSRDFPVGIPIISSICESIENSCRTILVLSNNFINSEWCKYEFKMAHFQTIQDRCCRLIVVILEDVNLNALDKKLKAYLKTNTYLRWGDHFFWEKLRFAMPDIEHLEEIGERQPLLLN